MVKWIYKPSGMCPVQAEGYFREKYFYFRSRWDRATIEFAETQAHWQARDLLKSYEVFNTGDDFGAGWLPGWFCKALIYKGCFKFFLNRRSNA